MILPYIILASVLSSGVEIPDDGVPMNEGWHQYTTRMEKRPAAITNETMYLKWKWRMNLANPATGLDNDALREGVKKNSRRVRLEGRQGGLVRRRSALLREFGETPQ